MKDSISVSETTFEEVLVQAELIFEKMDASDIIRTRTLALLQSASKKGLLESCTPDGGAAGAIYIACILEKLNVTQNFLSESSGISTSSIRKHYMLFARRLNLYRN
jgi:transcription initiation factor TFIIIB Brf1 subunit/transcription initiation factor TFIIB